jgi:hypothetical protein
LEGRTEAVNDLQFESALPKGWVPENAFVHVFAHRDDDLWEALIPQFAIASQGASLEDAASNAIELLDDYLVLCARDGRSFEESVRPIGSAFGFAVAVGLVETAAALLPRMARARLKHRRKPSRSTVHYKVPLRLVGVC